MPFSVEITYTRQDSTVPYWSGGDTNAATTHIVENYVTTGKIVNEFVTIHSALSKTFTRIFDTEDSYNTFKNDPVMSSVRDDRNAYCIANNITVSVVTNTV